MENVHKKESSDFWAGLLAYLPVGLGIIPFALTAGIAAAQAGLTLIQGIMYSLVVFAGASQIAMARLMAEGAPWIVIVLTGVLLNLRFMVLSLSLGPELSKGEPKLKRSVLAYLLTDQVFALCKEYFTPGMTLGRKQSYYLGGSLGLWTTWQIGSLVGLVFGLDIPPEWRLDFVVPLTFLCLLIPHLKEHPKQMTALVSAFFSFGLSRVLPYGLNVILGIILGVLAGFLCFENPSFCSDESDLSSKEAL